jgi:hypothetical protein
MIKSIKNHIRFQQELRRLKRSLRKELEARPEFFRAARKIFLAKFEEKSFSFGKKESGRSRIRKTSSWHFAFLGMLLVFLAGSGVMAMADQPGVGPGHPLYSVKKAGENIQLALASQSQKPFVHYQLAKNRLAEIKTLNDRISRTETLGGNQDSAGNVPAAGSDDKDQKELGELNQEFDLQIDAALKKIDLIDDQANDQASNLTSSARRKEKNLCQSIAVTLKERNSALENFDIDYEKDFSIWQQNCGSYMDVSPNGVSSSIGN